MMKLDGRQTEAFTIMCGVTMFVLAFSSFALGCKEGPGGFQCVCKEGYAGERCEK